MTNIGVRHFAVLAAVLATTLAIVLPVFRGWLASVRLQIAVPLDAQPDWRAGEALKEEPEEASAVREAAEVWVGSDRLDAGLQSPDRRRAG